MHRKSWLTSLPGGLALWLAFGFFRLLPLNTASDFGGWLGRHFGPRLKWHRIASANLRHALPEREADHAAILNGMWDNLGRTFAEYAWLHKPAMAARIEIPPQASARVSTGHGVIFAAGHLANWEIAALTGHLCGQPLTLIYRHASNPVADYLIRRIRARYSAAMYPKGKRGARAAMQALKEKKALGLLVDQRMNDGIELTFFGQPAMTASAPAELALRFRVPLLLARVIRTGGTNFRFAIEDILLPEDSGPEAAGAVMQQINDRLESWIREYPEQWLWIHRRWGNL